MSETAPRDAAIQPRVFEALLSNTPDFVYAIGVDKRFIYANKALLTMWGRSEENALGRDFLELGYEPWHAEMHAREVDTVVATKKPIRGTVPFTGTHGRRIYDYIFSPVFDEKGEVISIAGTTRDITEREETAEALALSERRMSLALEASEFVGTWDWDLGTNLVTADERFARLYSVDPAEAARGTRMEAFTGAIHPDDLARIAPQIERVSREGGKFNEEYRLMQPDGAVRWVVASGSGMLDAQGKPVRFAGVAIDITDRHRLQAVADSQKKALEMAAHDAPLSETLEVMIRAVERNSPVPVRSSILLLDAEGTRLRHGAAPSLPAEYNAAVDGIVIGPHQGACGHTASTGKVTISKDILNDPDWAAYWELARKHELRACWSKPILSSDEKLLGTFAIYYREPREPNQAERKALAFMARTAAIVIERGNLLRQRTAAERALSENHHQLQQMNDAIPQQVWTARPDGMLDYANRHAHEYIGDRKNADGTLDWASVIHPQDAQHTQRVWAESLASGKDYQVEQRILHVPSGAYRWNLTRALPIRNDAGEIVKWFGTNTDIEEQKRSAEAVNDAREHLSLMVESAQDYAIVSSDLTGEIVSWNKGAERMFGYTPEEVVGRPISLIFTPEDCAAGVPEHELSQAAEKGRASDERWHLRKNGERFYVSGIMTAMRDETHRIKGFIKIARDMTPQQQAQEALIEARNAAEAANIAKTEFLANMSHEIRTPMNAVIGLSNILAMSQPLTQKQQDYIKTLQLSADSLLALINDLLDIAKIEARTVELEQVPFNLTQIVQETISMMNVRVREKGLTMSLDGESVKERTFIGDPTRLRQIILNLCSNAVKFTETGNVHIHVQAKDGGTPGQEDICISVRDTGIGIAPEHVETIFQKFVQADTSINRKYGGTGLGLAITKTLAEIMGGNIAVESELGAGSVFTLRLTLPLASDHRIATMDLSLPHIQETSLRVPPRPHVLLVEDYAANILVATTFLEQFGYLVDVAENGIEAIDCVREGKGKYALALMDVQMHGMNGLEATQLIRGLEQQEGTPRLPIIGMTAHALSGDRERCLGAGMDDYIPKPFNPDELERLLKKYSADAFAAA